MAETLVHKFPYPDISTPPDGPLALQQLAEKNESKTVEIYAAINNPAEAAVPLTNAGGTSYQNEGGQTLKAYKSGRMVTVAGMVSRPVGAGTVVGNIAAGYRPKVNTSFSAVGINASNAQGPLFYCMASAGGDITVTALTGGAAWNTQTWIPINVTFLVP